MGCCSLLMRLLMRQLPEAAPEVPWLFVKLSRPLKVMEVTLSWLAGVFLNRHHDIMQNTVIPAHLLMPSTCSFHWLRPVASCQHEAGTKAWHVTEIIDRILEGKIRSISGHLSWLHLQVTLHLQVKP